jgi:hypothetical protein
VGLLALIVLIEKCIGHIGFAYTYTLYPLHLHLHTCTHTHLLLTAYAYCCKFVGTPPPGQLYGRGWSQLGGAPGGAAAVIVRAALPFLMALVLLRDGPLTC